MTFSAKVCVAVVGYAASVVAVIPYHLAESYDSTNFFDKFNFWEVQRVVNPKPGPS